MSAPTSSSASKGSIRDSNVAVVTVNYRTPELTERCIAALAKERERLPRLRAVVVDGGSGDGSADELAKTFAQPDYKDWVEFLPLAINGGFGWANNQAILTLARKSHPPEFIHILNPDTEIENGAVEALVKELKAHPECGAAGSLLIDGRGQTVGSAFRFPSPGREFIGNARSEKLGCLLGIGSIVVRPAASCEVGWVTGASVMFRAEALRQTGLFDDGFFLYFEEVELMYRMRRLGWTVRHVPESRVVHLEGAATGVSETTADRPLPDYWYESRRRYFALTGGELVHTAANVSAVAGLAISAFKRAIGRKSRGNRPQAQRLFSGSGGGVRSAIAHWGDQPGVPPAWMVGR